MKQESSLYKVLIFAHDYFALRFVTKHAFDRRQTDRKATAIARPNILRCSLKIPSNGSKE